MKHYVATVQLKHVTDGDRTFWHWQSTFDVPRGREQEFEALVGKGVYEGGFEGLRALPAPRRGCRSGSARGIADSQPAHAVVATAFGGPEVLRYESVAVMAPGPNEVRIRQTAVGVNYIDVYVRKGLYRMIQPPAAIGMEAAGVVLDVGDGVAHLLPGDRVAYACPPPGAYATRAHDARGPGGRASRRRERRDRGGGDAQGDDRGVPAASHAARAAGTGGAGARGGRRRRPAAVPVGEGAGRNGDRHGVERRQGAPCARPRLRVSDRDAGLSLCARSEEPHPRAWRRRDLRRPGPRGRGARTSRRSRSPATGYASARRADLSRRCPTWARNRARCRGPCSSTTPRSAPCCRKSRGMSSRRCATRRFAWSCATAIRSRRPPKRTANSKRGARRDRSCCCPDSRTRPSAQEHRLRDADSHLRMQGRRRRACN